MEEIRSTKYIKTNIYKGREINSFIFYNDDGTVFKSRYGYLERTIYPETIEGMDLSNVRRALKVNYTKKDNFYIPTKNYLNEPAIDLYIYTGAGGDIEILEDFETSSQMSEGETWYKRNLKLKTKYAFYFTNCIKCPEAVNNYGVKWEKATADMITITQHERIEKTEERKRADEMRAEFNKKFDTSFYKNEQLKEVYNFLKKHFESVED